MNDILFSIVIANYNYGRFLEEAIRSILAQGMNDRIEIIVCDAASTDNSVEIIKKYETKIAWWCSERDGGQSAAFNKGFSHAHGRFLTWLNADDILLPGALLAVEKVAVRHADCEWIVGSSFWADSKMRVERCFCAHRFSSLRAQHGFLTVGGPSSFFSRRLYLAAGKIDESLHYVMDTDLWYKFYFRCGARYRRTIHPVWCFRRHTESKMSGGDVCNSPQALKNREKAGKETRILDERYGRRVGFLCRMAQVLSFSIPDSIIAIYYRFKHFGRDPAQSNKG